MVPIGLQLMLCPSKGEGHIPPVICASFLQQLPEGAVCCGTSAAEKFQTEAKFLNPFENDNPAAGDEEVAVMRYTDAWLRMTSTERLECVSSLVGRVLVTDSMPGKISHVHFLAAMVADYVKKNLVVTSAAVAQIPREALAPRAQEVVDTATKSKKRGGLQHVREAARKWSRPIVKLAARPRPEAKPQPKAKAKPAVKRRPGALQAVLLATAATTAASLPKEVPLMHTQEDFNRLVIKVAPEGSLQGFHIPYIEDPINMEPCTLWAKFLLEEREEAAFSGPQIRACMGQQSGALNSKRAMQPLLETGLGNEATFQCGIRMANASWLPFDEVAFTEDMLFSAAWSVQHRQSLREQRREFGSVLAEMTRRLQPLQRQLKRCAVPHQHKLVDINVVMTSTTVCLIMWQANMLPTKLLQGHNLASTISTTGIFGEVQEEKPSMSREESFVGNHG